MKHYSIQYYSFDQIVLVGFILFSLDLSNTITVGSFNDLYTLHGYIDDDSLDSGDKIRFEELIK